MNPARTIIAEIGKETVKSYFHVGDAAISKVETNNLFPAAWFDGLEHLTGRELDRGLFNFKNPRASGASAQTRNLLPVETSPGA